MAAGQAKLQIRAVDRVTKTLQRVTSQFPRMTSAVTRANNRFKALQQSTEVYTKSLNRMGGRMRNVGKGMTIGLSAPIGLLGKNIFDMAVRFESSMNKVAALTGATGAEFKALEDLARELGSTTSFSASQAADAMAFLGMAGWKTNEILDATPGLLSLAASTGTELGRVADITSNIMGAFNLEAREAGRVSDILAKVTASSNVDMEQLADTMKYVAKMGATAGASLEEVAALTGLLGNVGIQGTVAATALKNILLGLAAPAGRAAKYMKAMGIEVSNADGSMRKVTDILGDLGRRMKDMPKAAQLKITKELFGKFGIAGGLELMTKAIEKGKNPIVELTKTLENSNGAAKKMADTLLRGAPGAVARFKSAWEGLGIAIAKSGVLDMIASFLESMANLFSNLSKTNPTLLKLIAIFVGLLAVLGPLLAGFGFMASGIAALIPVIAFLAGPLGKMIMLALNFTKVLGLLKFAVLGLGKALMFLALNPVGLIITAIAALALGVYMLIKHWSKVKDFFSNLWGSIVGIFSNSVGLIMGMLKRIPGIGALVSGAEFLFKKITGVGPAPALGPPVGAAATVTEVAERREERTNNARVEMDFKNVPRGTRVQSQAEGPFEMNLGMAGAMQ